MILQNDVELANTRQKLREVEKLYENLRQDSRQSARLRDMGLRSLKKVINQLKEEIARYEARQPTRP